VPQKRLDFPFVVVEEVGAGPAPMRVQVQEDRKKLLIESQRVLRLRGEMELLFDGD
jgi:hypothetical protein